MVDLVSSWFTVNSVKGRACVYALGKIIQCTVHAVCPLAVSLPCRSLSELLKQSWLLLSVQVNAVHSILTMVPASASTLCFFLDHLGTAVTRVFTDIPV